MRLLLPKVVTGAAALVNQIDAATSTEAANIRILLQLSPSPVQQLDKYITRPKIQLAAIERGRTRR
jgi:hypothetical protein